MEEVQLSRYASLKAYSQADQAWVDVEEILLGLIINHFGRFFLNASEMLNSLNLCLETQYIMGKNYKHSTATIYK